jgi:hypothetical protein
MEMDEEVWNHAVFSKNRERLLNEEIAEGFFRRVLTVSSSKSAFPAHNLVLTEFRGCDNCRGRPSPGNV